MWMVTDTVALLTRCAYRGHVVVVHKGGEKKKKKENRKEKVINRH